MAFFENGFCSDESFIRSIVHCNGFPFRSALVRENFRFNKGSKVGVSGALHDELRTSDAFFARKLEFQSSGRLFEWVDGGFS